MEVTVNHIKMCLRVAFERVPNPPQVNLKWFVTLPWKLVHHFERCMRPSKEKGIINIPTLCRHQMFAANCLLHVPRFIKGPLHVALNFASSERM